MLTNINKYMVENHLPYVQLEIAHSLAQSIFNDEGYLKKQLDILETTNPVIHEFIIQWMKEFDETDEQIRAGLGCIIVYKLLDNQLEVNQMERDLKLG